MGEMHVISSGFSYGELDPKLAARVDFAAYSRGCKTASNLLSIPQGGFTRRFGTRYAATLTATNYKYAELYSFIYDNSAVYCLVFENNSIKIYLENTLQATVVTTYPAEIVQQLSFVQIEDRLLILHQNFASAQLVRSAVAANIITGVDATNEYITVTNALTIGIIYPITFTTAGTLPQTDPQIYINTIYYARVISANAIRVYTTPEDAAANINYYNIIAVGGGVSNVILQNTWTLSNIPFSILPAFDFDAFATYSAAGFTFTASAVNGTLAAPVVITASGAVFTAAHVGGLFRGNGGVLRIVTFTDSTHVSGYTYEDFINTSAFSGREAFLGEPAWSATRGYPSCGTFFQERLFLAGSRQIPNGLWGSTLFSVYDFNDAESDADSAISFYPGAGFSNYINALTSSKSLIVHSNTGNYSTPLATDLPLTPSNFSLTEQNKDGISRVIPVFIDNQVIYIDRSGRNVKSMFWDIIQSSYVNTNISLPSAHLVQTPVDLAVFSEPFFTDGYYILAVNSDGQLAIYNSLTEQDIKGWTKASTTQNILNLIAGIDATNDYLTITDELEVGSVYEVTFTTTGTLPTTTPQIVINTPYFIRVILSTKVKIYTDEIDAVNDAAAYTISGAGAGTNKIAYVDSSALPPNGYFRRVTAGLNRAWTIIERIINGSTVLYLEELDFEYPIDCGFKIENSPASATLTGLAPLNGQSVQVYADGSVFPNQTVVGGQIVLDSVVSEAFVGLQFVSTFEPLPLNINLQTGPNLYQKHHIRMLYIHYYLSVGMQIQGYDIPSQMIQQVVLNMPAIPETGVLPYTLMEGWDQLDYTIKITQSLPLPMTILGLGYDVEV